MDYITGVRRELMSSWMQFATVAVGVAFLTPMLKSSVLPSVPLLNSIDGVYQSALLAGGYAVIGNWMARKY